MTQKINTAGSGATTFLTNVSPPLVYVAGAYSAPTRSGVEANIRRAEHYALAVARIGGMPVCPHTNTAHPRFSELQEYQFWIVGTMALMRVCNAVVMVEGWEDSKGAVGEREEAIRLHIPVFAPWQFPELAGFILEWYQR